MDRDLQLDVKDASLALDFPSLYLEPRPFPRPQEITTHPFDEPGRVEDLMLDSYSRDTPAVNRAIRRQFEHMVEIKAKHDKSAETREIRRHFERVAKMKHNMAMRETESLKPKRPLSAYNLFFKAEREKILKEKRKPGFADMGKEIAAKWKALDTDDRKQFDEEVLHEKRRYKAARSQWKAQAKLHSEKAVAYQEPRIMSLGEYAPTLTSLVDRHESDPTMLLDIYVQRRIAEEQQMQHLQFQPRRQLQQGFMEDQHTRQVQLQEFQDAAHCAGPRRLVQEHVMDQQQMRQAQLQNATLVAGPRRMPKSSFFASSVERSEESGQCASLPMSLQGSIGHHFSSCNMTTYHQGLSLSSVPPLSSTEPNSSDPVDFLEPYTYGDSGGGGAFTDPELANAIMNMPFSPDIDTSQVERNETYDPMISCMLEPSPIRRSSMPSSSNDSQRFGALQNRRSYSMPICGVGEMSEVQGIMHLLECEISTEAEW